MIGAIVFAVVGIVLVGLSAAFRAGRPKGFALDSKGQNTTDSWRLWMFIGWTLALPLWWLVEWYVYAAPSPPANFPAFQYGRKVVTDLWTAIAVVLGLLFGIKKGP
jgi:hypothetical protein